MDVQGWLQHIADREPPERADRENFDNFHQSFQSWSSTRSDERSRRQKKLATTIRRHRRPFTNSRNDSTPRHLNSDHARVRKVHHARSRGPEPRTHSNVKPMTVPVQLYERQVRRKTRLDHYEPKQRKHKRRRKSHDSSPTRKAMHSRRHQKKDEGRMADLLQSFQLKTGPPQGRLTLRPNGNIGIFKHGRASIPAVSCGPGCEPWTERDDRGPRLTRTIVPDLVFNEMRFLQQQRKNTPQKQPYENDHADQQDREKMSAYFNQQCESQQQNAPERVVKLFDSLSDAEVALRRRMKGIEQDKYVPNISQVATNLSACKENGRRKGGGVNLTFESAVPYGWSKSASRYSPIINAEPPKEHLQNAEERSEMQKSTDSSNERPVPRCAPSGNHHAHNRSAFGQGSVHRRNLQRADNQPMVSTSRNRKIPVTDMTTSQSLPRPSLRARSRQTSSERLQAANAEGLTDYNTSDILKIRPSFWKEKTIGSPPCHDPHLNAETVNNGCKPATSSPDSHTLRCAFGSMVHANDLRAMTPASSHSQRLNVPTKRGSQESDVIINCCAREATNADPFEGCLVEQALHPFCDTNQRIEPLYENARTLIAGQTASNLGSKVGTVFVAGTDHHDEDDDMLDTARNGVAWPAVVGQTSANAQQAENLVRRLTGHPAHGFITCLSQGEHFYPWHNQHLALSSQDADNLIDEGVLAVPHDQWAGDESKHNTDASVHHDPHELGPFWRPQKLY